eukprot:scaffold7909_cov36-Tisochrysis_lutea.AAC.6
MANSSISILNLSTHDRDFVLVSERDVEAATALIREKCELALAQSRRCHTGASQPYTAQCPSDH